MTDTTLLREGLMFIMQAIDNSPHSSAVCIQDGKMQYAGRGVFVQVENDATKSLPDCTLPASAIPSLQHWLFTCDSDKPVMPTLSRAELSLTGDCHDETGRTLIRLPLLSFSDAYREVDEIILKPLLVNQYEFFVPENVLFSALNCLKKLYDDKESHIPVVSVLVDTDSATFGSENRGVSIIRKIPLHDAGILPKWQNGYVLDAVRFRAPTRYTEQYAFAPVKISYTDNTKALKSPLMLTYENGVTVVAAPLWT